MANEHQRYRIDQLISSGVIEDWSGLDRTLDRPVTIRVLDTSTEVGMRVQLQARALIRLEHPSLLHVLDTVEFEDRFGLVTETLPQQTLQDYLSTQGTISAEESLSIVISLGEALDALHRAGFAAGEIQPKHVGRRSDGTVVIVNGPPTADANKIPATAEDDIASLGELIHELLVGFRPQIDHQGRFELHSSISSSFREIIHRCIDRNNQWSDASALVLSLRSLHHDLDQVSLASTSTQVDYLKEERTWLAPAGFIAFVASIVILAGFLISRTEVGSSLVENVREVVRLERDDTFIVDNFENSLAPPLVATTRPDTAARQLQILRIIDFDPAGDDQAEHPGKLDLINNNDSSRGWNTERYTTSDFGNLKEGVGLIIQLGPPQQIDRMRISSPSIDWSFEIFASEDTTGAIQTWGDAVLQREKVSGTVTVDLNGTSAATLLLWITSLGKELPSGGHRVTISELSVTGRPLYG